MPMKRCWHYSDDGSPKNGGCRSVSNCNFVHPSEPNWHSAPKSEPFNPNRGKDRGNRGGFDGSSVPRKRSYAATANDSPWDNSNYNNGPADDSTMAGDGGWGRRASGSGRGQGGGASSSGWGSAPGTGDSASTSAWPTSGDSGGQKSGSSWGQSTGGGWGQSTGGGWGDAAGAGWGDAAGAGWGDAGGGGGGSGWGETANSGPGDAANSNGGAASQQQPSEWGTASDNTSSAGWGALPPPPTPTMPSLPPPNNDMEWTASDKPPSPALSMSVPSTPVVPSAFVFADRQSSRQPSETPSSLRGSVHGSAHPPESIQGRYESWVHVIKKFVRAVNTQRKINEAEETLRRTKNLQNSKEYERVCPGGQLKLDGLRSQHKEALLRANADFAADIISLCSVPDESSFLSGLDPEPHNNEAQRYLEEVKAWISNMDPIIQKLVDQEEAALAQKEEDGEPVILPIGTEALFHDVKQLEIRVRDIGEQHSQTTEDALRAALQTKVEGMHDEIASAMRQAQESAMDELLREPVAQLQHKEEQLNSKILGVVEEVTKAVLQIEQVERTIQENREIPVSTAKHYAASVRHMSAIDRKQAECEGLLKELEQTKAQFAQAFPTTPPAAVCPSREELVSALVPFVQKIVHEELKPVLDKKLAGTQRMIADAEESNIAKIWYPIQDVAVLGKWLEMSSSRAAGAYA